MTVQILTPIRLSDETPNPHEFKLEHNYDIVFDGKLYRCPVNMPTDGTSRPRPLWSIGGHPFSRPMIRAAVPHDGGYRGLLVDENDQPIKVSRLFADEMFYAICLHVGVLKVQAAADYRMLRLCGWTSYKGGA